MKKISTIILMTTLFVMLYAVAVSAQPYGADQIGEIGSDRSNVTNTTPSAINAQAGNVTELEINASAITSSWAGYYGNITGTIILADSQGNNFYDWNMSNPGGEVYAARVNNVDWTTINCTNSSEISAEETYLGQSASDGDSVSTTYASTAHPAFYIGTANTVSCPSTHAYDSTGDQGTGFWQVLLSDGSSNTVYSTIIDGTVQTGFNNRDWHFELLVGENGKTGSEALTPYYFYVELE